MNASGSTTIHYLHNKKAHRTMETNLSLDMFYKADIVPCGKQEFENTSVVTLFPNAMSTELWPYCISHIALYEFKNFPKEIE